jgi:hypothetical protein
MKDFPLDVGKLYQQLVGCQLLARRGVADLTGSRHRIEPTGASIGAIESARRGVIKRF